MAINQSENRYWLVVAFDTRILAERRVGPESLNKQANRAKQLILSSGLVKDINELQLIKNNYTIV